MVELVKHSDMSADISINNAGWSETVVIIFLSKLVVWEAIPYTNTEPDVLVISQYEYDILVITRVRGKAKDKC